MDNSFSNEHLVVMTLVHVPIGCLWPHIACLDIPAPFTGILVLVVFPGAPRESPVINLKDIVLICSTLLIWVIVASNKTIDFSCPVLLESLFCNHLQNM